MALARRIIPALAGLATVALLCGPISSVQAAEYCCTCKSQTTGKTIDAGSRALAIGQCSLACSGYTNVTSGKCAAPPPAPVAAPTEAPSETKPIAEDVAAPAEPAQEKVEETLAGRGVIEDIAEERSERGFFDKGLEPIGRAFEAAEKELINGGVTSDELRRMQVPALVKAGAQRMHVVIETKAPRCVDDFAVLSDLRG